MANEVSQQTLLAEFKKVYQRFDALESKIENLHDQLSTLTAQHPEATDDVKALLRQTKDLSTKYDSLLKITVSKDAFEKIATKIDLINNRILLRMKKSDR